MKCLWCRDEKDPFRYGGGLQYCSTDCENAAIRHAAACFDAVVDGEDPPTKEDFMALRHRARRWDPDSMQERIDELAGAV